MERREGRVTTPATLLLARGVDHMPWRGPAPHVCYFRADQFPLRYSPVVACSHPSRVGIGGCFGEGCGDAGQLQHVGL